jgi:glycosyltransferase involved in cell wall biosynthesis
MHPDKLRIIPNGVSPSALLESSRPTPTQVEAAAGRHAFTVGFAGTLGQANALDTLIAAARLLSGDDVGIVIVGQGPEEARLRTLAADLDNVFFVGPVAKPDVPATLKAFDVCYVGYHRSSLYRLGISPNKVFDYMAAARPIILAASAANDPVRDGNCGLTVEPDDPAALAQAVRSLRSVSPDARARMGSNGRTYVERVHSYATLAELYIPVLDAAVQ